MRRNAKYMCTLVFRHTVSVQPPSYGEQARKKRKNHVPSKITFTIFCMQINVSSKFENPWHSGFTN